MPDEYQDMLDKMERAANLSKGIAAAPPLLDKDPAQTPVDAKPAPAPVDRTPEYTKRAEEDVPQIATLRGKFEAAAKKHAVPVEYLEGVISRETRVGKALPSTGYGGKDNKMFGIGQINSEVHELRGTEAPDSDEHLDQSAEILSGMKQQMDKKFPTWAEEARWRAAIAAYNTGPGNVKRIDDPDARTDGHDYSQDVLIRAKTFRQRFHTNKKRR